MDSFYDLFMNFLKRQRGSCVAVNEEYLKLSDFIKKICVQKMNESLTGVE